MLRFIVMLGVLFVGAVSAAALENPGETLQEVAIVTELGAQVDIDLPLVDSQGGSQTLRAFAAGKPLVLVPAYYECPRLCGLVLSGVISLLKRLTLSLGEDFKVAVVSFDPSEGSSLARKRAVTYWSQLRRDSTDDSRGSFPDDMTDAQKETAFQFFVGSAEVVSSLMRQIGFNVKKDHDEFAHGAAIMILTPEGKISQYFSGIEFSSFDARLALVEASKGAIGNALDHVYLFCFRFDPTKGKYTWAAFNLMRVGAIATFLLLATLVFRLAQRSIHAGQRKGE
jgi:protein SCO1